MDYDHLQKKNINNSTSLGIHNLVGGIPTPLKNDGLRQLGL